MSTFGVLLAITGAWWGLALWPMSTETPAWLARAQYVCFGTLPGGLPDAAGWTALVLQPAIMFGALGFMSGDALRDALRALARLAWGRAVLASLGVVAALGAGLAGGRVVRAAQAESAFEVTDGMLPDTYPRLDVDAPAIDLVDQFGGRLTLERFRGRPVLVTFAFGHCKTVCPVVVRDLIEAKRRLNHARPVVLVITLDPWRDVPSRLPAIARQWQMGDDDFIGTGAVEAVERTLDSWNVGRRRDPATGDIVHPRLIYLVDQRGRLAYALTRGVDAIVDLVGRL
ncbi:MAG: SCO family protein [Gemmatimonadales bacterium]